MCEERGNQGGEERCARLLDAGKVRHYHHLLAEKVAGEHGAVLLHPAR
jgi:hypothetical protein